MSASALRRLEAPDENSWAGPRRTVHRFYDAQQAAWIVKIFPGDFHVTESREEVLVTVLGSCVAACVRDPVLAIGGMNHFMLTQNHFDARGSWGSDCGSTRYGNFAMEKLINELMKRGSPKDRLEVKVFGGANVTTSKNRIGAQNCEFVLDYLKAEGLPCVAQDLGGTLPRRIAYVPSTGRVIRKFLSGYDHDAAITEESQYATSLQSVRSAGDVQLFK